MIEGHPDMRYAGTIQQHQQAAQQAERRAHFPAIGSFLRRRTEEVTEKLVGTIDKVDFHSGLFSLITRKRRRVRPPANSTATSEPARNRAIRYRFRTLWLARA